MNESKADSRGATMVVILSVILIILLCALGSRIEQKQPIAEAVIPTTTEVPAPEIKHGQYTIFHYTRSGWVNTLYVTDYYITDRIIYYKSREHQEEFMEIPFDECLPQPGYIENVDELMEYGYWEPAEIDW